MGLQPTKQQLLVRLTPYGALDFARIDGVDHLVPSYPPNQIAGAVINAVDSLFADLRPASADEGPGHPGLILRKVDEGSLEFLFDAAMLEASFEGLSRAFIEAGNDRAMVAMVNFTTVATAVGAAVTALAALSRRPHRVDQANVPSPEDLRQAEAVLSQQQRNRIEDAHDRQIFRDPLVRRDVVELALMMRENDKVSILYEDKEMVLVGKDLHHFAKLMRTGVAGSRRTFVELATVLGDHAAVLYEGRPMRAEIDPSANWLEQVRIHDGVDLSGAMIDCDIRWPIWMGETSWGTPVGIETGIYELMQITRIHGYALTGDSVFTPPPEADGIADIIA